MGNVKQLMFILLILIILSLLPLISSSPNQPNDDPVGYELLDGGDVLHIWNVEDDYYFDADSGMQFTNNYDEYWSKNVFCGGYYLNGSWNVLACVDELPFTWDIDTDDETYINVTGYRDVSYQGYDVRFALRYHLKTYDTRISIIPYVKNIGTQDIPFVLGFAWHIRDIAIGMQEENNTINVYSDQGYPEVSLHGLNYSTTLTNGSFFLNNKDTEEHILLEWNQNLDHILMAKPSGGQYNSPVTLGIKIGTLVVGQEKTTTFGWIDAGTFYCETKGRTGNEDICFINSVTADNNTNYSDATFINEGYPYFKITHQESSPYGCTWNCYMYRQSTLGGDWTQMFASSGSGCYNKLPSEYQKCSGGHCKILHTKTEDNRTQWDLCIAYEGELCSEDGEMYCGIQYGGSSKGDKRVNMSHNDHTPTAENVTLINTSFNLSISYDFSDLDGDEEGNKDIEWYFNDEYNSSFDDEEYINLSDICGNVTYRIKVYDDSYFSPTGNETWVWSIVTYYEACPDITPPVITWINPTPSDGAIVDTNYVYLNTTITDISDTSAFFDWDYDLIGYWGMDYYNPSGIRDRSSYNNFGTFNNGLSSSDITTGKYGNALEFDGNNDYVNAGNDNSLEMGTSDMTFSVWVKFESSQKGDNVGLFGKGAESNENEGYIFKYFNSTDKLSVAISNGTVRTHFHSNEGLGLKDDAWHHLVAVVDRDDTVSFYVDGILSGSLDVTTYSGQDINNPDRDLMIGSWMYSNWYLNGTMDEARIFKRALSPEEINASFNNGLYRLYNNFTDLSAGAYDYSAYAIDLAGNLNITAIRNVTIVASAVTNETLARQAILEGITNSIPTATIYTDQQIYTVTFTNQQSQGKFDKVAILSNQTWAFNYITSGENYAYVNPLLNIVNIWENETLPYSQIITQVENLIDNTKI